MPLRRVARFLADSGYDPKVGAEFAVNYLCRRVSLSRRMGYEETKDAYAFASICAVPHRQTDDTYSDFSSVLKWLQPQSLIEYDPPGSWLPLSSKRLVSTGVVLVDDDISTDTRAKPWSAYLLARRDGYFEYGRRAGHLNREQTNNYISENIVYQFGPMVAWIQRFAALVNDARSRQTSSLNYSLVLNIPRLEGAVLGSLGAGWREPFDRPYASRPLTAIERSVQLQLELGDEPDPRSIGRWSAERIDNVFGVNEVYPRCYNHPTSDGRLGPPGDLPGNGIDYPYG